MYLKVEYKLNVCEREGGREGAGERERGRVQQEINRNRERDSTLYLVTELALYIISTLYSRIPPPHSLFCCQIKKDGIGTVYCCPPTQVSVIDAAAMGEAIETFTVCASPIHCIAAVPGFNENDPDVLTSKPLLISAIHVCVCVC